VEFGATVFFGMGVFTGGSGSQNTDSLKVEVVIRYDTVWDVGVGAWCCE
jgi:hypothetical protein